jgi:hypothetical protein
VCARRVEPNPIEVTGLSVAKMRPIEAKVSGALRSSISFTGVLPVMGSLFLAYQPSKLDHLRRRKPVLERVSISPRRSRVAAVHSTPFISDRGRYKSLRELHCLGR